MKKQNYFKENSKIFIDSFKKLDKSIIYIILLDLIFYLLIFGGIYAWAMFLQKEAVKLQSLHINNLMSSSPEQLKDILGIMKGVLFKLVFSILGLIILTIALLSFFKGFIWNIVLKKKFTVNFYWKFLLLNLLWLIIWLISIIIIGAAIKRNALPYLLIIALLFIIYFTNLLFIFFTKEIKFNVIKKTFAYIKKIHYFILPYLAIIVVFIIVSQLYWIYKFFPQSIITAVSGLITLALLAWSRYYLVNVVNYVEKKK